MSKFGMSLFAGLMMIGAMACDDGVADKAENRIDCRVICSQAMQCVDSIDEGDCTTECAQNSKNDAFEDKANDCADCLDVSDNCKENSASCAPKCAGVVTLSST